MYICTCVCTYVRIGLKCTQLVHICAQMYIQMCVRMCVCTYVHTYVRSAVLTRTSTCFCRSDLRERSSSSCFSLSSSSCRERSRSACTGQTHRVAHALLSMADKAPLPTALRWSWVYTSIRVYTYVCTHVRTYVSPFLAHLI